MQRRAAGGTANGSETISLNGNGATTSAAHHKSSQPKQQSVRRVRRKKKPTTFSEWHRSSFGRGFGAEDSIVAQIGVLALTLFLLICITVHHALSSSTGESAGSTGGVDDLLKPDAEKLRKSNIRIEKKHGGRSFLASLTNYGYDIPGSMEEYGDKTRRYAKLREQIDSILPFEEGDLIRMETRVKELRKRTYEPIETFDYEITNCPLYPPEGYPKAWNILDILENWSPDDPKPVTRIYQGLCIFDHKTELIKAKNYREAEVPFIIRDDPDVLRTVERWNHPGYLEDMLSTTPHRTEYSPNNHFMYWQAPKNRKGKNLKRRGKKIPEGWKQPTEMLRMPYAEWLEHANTTDDMLGPDKPHWYYRLIACGAMGDCDRDSSEYVFDELTFFQPKESLYIVDPEKQKGIHCRFGMKGVIAENHFDGSRNMIVLLGGERRYILSHPDQCDNLALLPKEHPSGRHSAVDWSDPDLDAYPQFRNAESNEVVLQAGDVLYLPTNWFHYIISLELNWQCNTRSGISDDYMKPIHKCGF